MEDTPIPPDVAIPVAIGLILANGFFVASEFALVKVRHSRLQELADRGSGLARQAQRLTGRLDLYLAAAQLGITVASLSLGWIGEPAVAALLQGPLAQLGIPESWSLPISIALGLFIITALHITIGEQVPKMLAIVRPERWALIVTPGLRLFYLLASPAIRLLNATSNGLLRLLRVPARALHEEPAHSDQELRILLAAAGRSGILDPIERALADRSLVLGDVTLDEIMIPRVAIRAIRDELTLADARARAIASGHDWLPVYHETIDDIVGVVEWRDLFGADDPDWRSRVREVLYLPQGVSASVALARLRATRSEMAILLDEYGGTAGLVTIRTLYEEVTRPETGWDPSTEVPGRTPLRIVEDLVGAEAPEEEAAEAATIGGYVVARLGRFAAAGDEVSLGRWMIRVTRVDPRRQLIAGVRLVPPGGGV